MKHIICFLILILGIEQVFAQPNIDAKRDYTWCFGGGYGANRGRIIINMNQVDMGLYAPTNQFVKPMDDTNTSISDTSGNLLFYSNGFQVFDRNHALMEEGDSLNFPSFIFFSHYQDGNEGYPARQSALILPHPLQDSTYWLFHTPIEPIFNDTLSDLKCSLWYTVVDMRLNGGIGAVTRKNIPLVDSIGFANPSLAVCRHANGRDWWLLLRELYSDKVWRYIFSPSGFEYIGLQHIGITANARGVLGQSLFSPDGSKLAYAGIGITAEGSKFNYFDFDRCTGLLSNPIQVNGLDYGMGGVGCAFSPNSRYLYLSYPYALYQYDTQDPDMMSHRVTVANYDGFVDTTTGFGTSFWVMQLASDNQIYIGGNSTRYLHTIKYPDVGGVNCTVNQHSVFIETVNQRSMPYFPHYRLGALHGSGCDTLGFGAGVGIAPQQVGGNGFSVYPNPTRDKLYVGMNHIAQGAVLTLSNSLGQVLSHKTLESTTTETELSLGHLPAGIYYLQVQAENQIFTEKIMKE